MFQVEEDSWLSEETCLPVNLFFCEDMPPNVLKNLPSKENWKHYSYITETIINPLLLTNTA